MRNLAVASLIAAVDPFLSRSIGFALSVLACAGIVVGSKLDSDHEPLAAGDHCRVDRGAVGRSTGHRSGAGGHLGTSQRRSLVANALAGPFVGPATVLGFAAAGASLISGTLAAVFGFGAAGVPR